MEQDHDVEALLDRPAIAGLLVTAVAEISRMAVDLERQSLVQLLIAQTDEMCRVMAVIVVDDHFRDSRCEVTWYPVENGCQCGGGVVSDNEDADPFQERPLTNASYSSASSSGPAHLTRKDFTPVRRMG